MPVLPEFIPLAKQKEMFAVSSWRDSPQSTPATALAAVHPMLLSPAVLPAAQCEKDAAAQGKGHRSRRGRGRGKTRSAQRQQDVDDFFVNCVLPPGVTFATLKSELSLLATTPLRTYDVGSPRLLFPRCNGSVGTGGAEFGNVDNSGAAAAAATTTTTTTAATTTTTTTDNNSNNNNATSNSNTITGPEGHAVAAAAEADGGAATANTGCSTVPANKTRSKQSGMDLSPFRTPMVAAVAAPVDDGDESPGTSLPDLTLPPSVPSEKLLRGHLISLLFAESSEAENFSELLQKKWPQAAVVVVSRNRSVLNASLVLKGLPSLTKTERIIDELEKAIPHKPSYIRLHRGERGVFKNVIFVKYPSREVAEECKLRLERFVIGSRPLKVEFKKKEKGTTERDKGMTLQQLVRDLRVSTEHEGFVYQRADLTKDEVRSLKQLCNSYGLSCDLGEHAVTVKRILPGSGRPSPALRPSATPPLACWAQATPASLRPMDFRGIRHWQEIRTQSRALGIKRPKHPGDVPAFAPGRGRPL